MVTVHRSAIDIRPDPNRVLAKAFLPGEATFSGGPSRVELISRRILALDVDEADRLLEETRQSFKGRHRDLEAAWDRSAESAIAMVPSLATLERSRRSLLGAFFTQEYAPQAAAICNPSMVPFDDSDDGNFLMSLRAIGEGHISSVEFRTGRVAADGSVHVDDPAPFLSAGRRQTPTYEKGPFVDRLIALKADPDLVHEAMDPLDETFTYVELESALELLQRSDISDAVAFETSRLIHWMAASNYELVFTGDEPISERILHPAGPADSRGIEDTRFVRFTEDDGRIMYYATYTAFDGFTIMPQLIRTADFVTFRFTTISGACAVNKGMALFPRRVNGLYTALGRHDVENLHLLRSDRVRVWEHAELLHAPQHGWESVQVGNCGSPVETPEGWVVLTHGVGPMRRYSLGALLLDLEEPTRVIGSLESPLLEPNEEERDGYVPNVVYSCGPMAHDGWLVIPYGFSDRGIRIATVRLDELVAAMT